MLDWFRQQIKDHGVVNATRLLGRVALSRIKIKLGNKLLPLKVACPCCGWRGNQFYDYIEIGYTLRKVACPQCDSHPRHRQLSLWLSREFKLEDKNGVAVVFAPEQALSSVWAQASRLKVLRIDLEDARSIDLLADIKNMPVASNSVDLLWCHHVLEHVEDDRAAMRELHRILRPASGELVVSVPMAAARVTDEYGFPDPMQSGHWRMYGDDFEARLIESGLIVQAVNFHLPQKDYQRYAFTPERFYLCKKN